LPAGEIVHEGSGHSLSRTRIREISHKRDHCSSGDDGDGDNDRQTAGHEEPLQYDKFGEEVEDHGNRAKCTEVVIPHDGESGSSVA
jgi:hypothetical protein